MRRHVVLAALALQWVGCRAEPDPPVAPESAAPGEEDSADPVAVAQESSVRPRPPKGKLAQPTAANLPHSCETVDECRQILEGPNDSDALRDAAVTLATLTDSAALELLRERLGDPRFLAQLDASPGTDNLTRVFRALETRPSPEVATLCVQLAQDPDFLKVDERLLPLLKAAAAVKPMTDETAALFEKQNARGYATSNAVLLGHNASPKALALFEMLLYAKGSALEDQVELVHTALLPVRTEASVIGAVTRWLRRKNPTGLEVALVETVFEYKPAAWFGKRRNPPTPPPWTDASEESLQKALTLAKRQRGNKRLPGALRQTVKAAASELTALLTAK